MKTIVIVLIGLLVCGTLAAKNNQEKELEQSIILQTSILSGKVCDKTTGEELVGVALKIEGSDKLIYSDFEGNFKFVDVVPGRYKLVVEMISYNEIETAPILVQTNEVHELNIGLEQKK